MDFMLEVMIDENDLGKDRSHTFVVEQEWIEVGKRPIRNVVDRRGLAWQSFGRPMTTDTPLDSLLCITMSDLESCLNQLILLGTSNFVGGCEG